MRLLVIVMGMMVSLSGFARCDPTVFASDCNIPISSVPDKSEGRVYCGKTIGYISRQDYEVLRRYQRAKVNMILTFNGEYLDSPCIPAGRYQ